MTSDSLIFISSWDPRPEIILALLVAAAAYTNGWRRLRGRGRGQLASGRRLAAYLAGISTLAVALMSPIDVMGGLLFFMHMIQHLLLITVAPVLLLLANPFPFLIWGLPGGRQLGAALFSRYALFRRGLRQLTPPGVVWMILIAFLWGWHDPNAYNAALRYPLVHDLQHLTFFLPGVLTWWMVFGAAPRLHRPASPVVRIVFLLATAAANMIPGVVIALAGRPIYTYYLGVPRLWGISVMQDQVISGLIMWIPGTMMYLLAALFFLGTVLNQAGKPDDQLWRIAPARSN